MTVQATARTKAETTRERILDAAQELVLAKGYSGTTVDEILAETGLTKGAFFYHFKSKSDLARTLVERFWRRDQALMMEQWREAERRSDDPLERIMIWFRLFEDLFSSEDAPVACLFASYLYERDQFDPEILAFVRTGFREWAALYEQRLAEVLETRRPKVPVTAAALAETAIALVQGGFVLSQSHRDMDAVPRQSRRFRQYLELLFEA